MMFRIMGQIITYIYIYIYSFIHLSIHLFSYSFVYVYGRTDSKEDEARICKAGSHVWACFMFSTQRICHTDLTHAGLEAQQVCC